MKPSLKKRFAFRLATTSFVYPATWADNIRRLAPLVDEIELLFFESGPGSLPSPDDITEMKRCGREGDVGFNVHLPLDVCLGDLDAGRHRQAVGRIIRLIGLCRPLTPTSYTLHLPAAKCPGNSPCWESWRRRCRAGIEALLSGGVDRRLLAVETLIYPPFERVQDLVADYGLCVCLDMGHLLMCGQDPLEYYRRLKDRIAIVHLHGVENGRDHLGLDHLPTMQLEKILETLSVFTGTVSLEVFSPSALHSSLVTLGRWLDKYRQ